MTADGRTAVIDRRSATLRTTVDPDIEPLKEEQDARDYREHAADPDWQRQPEEHVQPEDQEENGEEDVAHVGNGFGVARRASDLLHQHENEHDDEHEAEAAARHIAPAPAVRPGGKSANEQE